MPLDLTAAFNGQSRNPNITPGKLCGIKGTALRWFESYLTDRSFSVQLGDYSSGKAPLTCGLPQGSILGPVFFSLYMLPCVSIIEKYNVSFHCFADNIQIYLPLNHKTKTSLQPLLDCLNDIKSWMDSNFLKLNNNKTEDIIFVQSELQDVDNLGPLAPHFTVKRLGVQISSVVRGSFFFNCDK